MNRPDRPNRSHRPDRDRIRVSTAAQRVIDDTEIQSLIDAYMGGNYGLDRRTERFLGRTILATFRLGASLVYFLASHNGDVDVVLGE